MRRIVVGGLVAILALTGCSGQANDPGKDASGTNNLSYDVSSIQKVDAIAAMVPVTWPRPVAWSSVRPSTTPRRSSAPMICRPPSAMTSIWARPWDG